MSTPWLPRFIVCLASCLAAESGYPAEAATSHRWAIMAADPQAAVLADLLTVELSRWPDLQLVERDRIGTVLQELRLNASGLVAAERATEFGQLVGAEVVLFVESLPKLQPPQYRLRANETRTGIRLLDVLAPAPGPAAAVATWNAELRQAQGKLQAPATERRYVGVAGVRSEEPGEYLTPVAQALTTFLEHDLRRAPRVLILERDQLQRLTAERDLTGNELELRASTLIVEVGLRREADGPGYVFHIQLAATNGQNRRDATARSPNQEISEVRQVLAREIGQALNTPLASAGAEDVKREAEFFAQRSAWLFGNGRLDEGLRAAESAVALHPTREHYRLAYLGHDRRVDRAEGTLQQLILPRNSADRQQACSAALKDALSAALRAHELDVAQLRDAIRDEAPIVMTFGVNEDPFRPHVAVWTSEESDEQRQLRAELDRLRWVKYRLLEEYHRRREETLLGLLVPRLGYVNYFSSSPEEFCRTILELQSQIEAELANFKALNVQSGRLTGPNRIPVVYYQDRIFHLLCDQIRWTGKIGPRSSDDRELRQWPAASLQPLWSALSRHRNPWFRLPGLYGLTRLAGSDGVTAARQLQQSLAEAPTLTGRSRVAATILGRQAEDKLRGNAPLKIPFPMGNEFGPSAPPAPDQLPGPWKELAIRALPIAYPANDSRLCAVHVDRHAGTPQTDADFILLWRHQDRRVTAERRPVRGGMRQPFGHALPWQSEWLAGPGDIRVADAPAATFVSCRQDSLAWLTEADTRLLGAAEGAPGKEIFALAWFENALYLGFRNGLARFDPGSSKFALLASSHAVRPAGPLDGGETYYIRDIIADPEHGCLWLTVMATVGGDRFGIWKYSPERNEFIRVFHPGNSCIVSNLSWRGQSLFFCSASRDERVLVDERKMEGGGTERTYREAILWFELEPKSGAVTRLTGYRPFEPNDQRLARGPRFLCIGDRVIGADAQLYAPDGSSYRVPLTGARPWDLLEPCGQGFVAGNFGGPRDTLWLAEPSPTSR